MCGRFRAITEPALFPGGASRAAVPRAPDVVIDEAVLQLYQSPARMRHDEMKSDDQIGPAGPRALRS
jgi:hypothetical protein